MTDITPAYPLPYAPDPSGKACFQGAPGPTWRDRCALQLVEALVAAGATTATASNRTAVARHARLLAEALIEELANPTTGNPAPIPPRPAPPASPANDTQPRGILVTGACAVCGRTAPLVDRECPDCRH